MQLLWNYARLIHARLPRFRADVARMLAEAGETGRRDQTHLDLVTRANAMSAGLAEGERVGAARALTDAADVVCRVREDGPPDGVWSHPSAEHFERWLRTRAVLAQAAAAKGANHRAICSSQGGCSDPECDDCRTEWGRP